MKELIYIFIVLSIFILFLLLFFSYKPIQKESFQQIVDESSRKALVIVEPRKHPLLKYVCENFNTNIHPSWDLYVFHGKSAGEFAKEATANIISRNVYLLPLDVDNLTADTYNELFKQLSFWNKVKAENILVFQTDAVACGKSEFSIEQFTKYDYIGCSSFGGAIGNEREVWGPRMSEDNIIKNSFYGVGGLSFRKNSFQKECIRKNPMINPDYPEDVFYSNCVEKSENKPRSAEVIQNFCTQDSFDRRSFGAHQTKLMPKEQKKQFFKFCPEAEIL